MAVPEQLARLPPRARRGRRTMTTTTPTTVVDRLRQRHEATQDYRLEHGTNPPGFPFWRVHGDYKRREFRPMWVSDDGNTVVNFATAWTWGQSGERAAYGNSPLTMIETCFYGLTVEAFTWNTVDMGGMTVERVHGSFAEYSAGFLLETTDRDLCDRLATAASHDLPWRVEYLSTVGSDPAEAKDWKSSSREANAWARTLVEDYKVDAVSVGRAD